MTRKKSAGNGKAPARRFIPCTIKQLPRQKLLDSARVAVDINPANAPPIGHVARMFALAVPSPDHLALLTTKYWQTDGVKLGVYFMDTSDSNLKQRILSHMNAWQASANVQFSEASKGMAQVRLARRSGDGYWSYLGVDVLQIPKDEPTLNLDSFSMSTSESEYKRVVRHETGHTLGFIHEHLRRELVRLLDPQKTVAYFMRTQGWSQSEVEAQVLTPAEEATLTATPHADQLSIMCYQISGECTLSGQPIEGGLDIDQMDYDQAAKLYPRATAPPPPPPGPPSGPAPLFTQTFNRAVPRGGQFWGTAPVAIPKGSKLSVFSPSSAPVHDFENDSPLEESPDTSV